MILFNAQFFQTFFSSFGYNNQEHVKTVFFLLIYMGHKGKNRGQG
jgi:hypothetical protein